MEKYIDYEMCKKCGGVCCKQNGCVYLPKDFKSLEASEIIKELDKGKISISGQPVNFFMNNWTYIPYLRARNKDAEIVDLITNGGPCINLTDSGCSLSENERPSCGLLVKPVKIGGPCEKIKKDVGIEWLEYSNVLESLIKLYTNKDMIDVVVSQISEKIVSIKKKINNNIPLSEIEKLNMQWYYQIMANKPYYEPDEVKNMTLILH